MFENLLPGVQHLQNIHPVVVHFPIAFLTGAALFYVLGLIRERAFLASMAFTLLLMGALSALAAVGTGLYAGPGVMVSRSVREHLLEVHKKLMITTLFLSLILTAWAAAAHQFPRKGRLLFVLLLLIMVGMMSVGADYGARMVYDYNAGGSACSQPIEFTR